MATVQISYEFADGEELHVTIADAEGFPDALDEARGQALRLFGDAMGVVVAALVDGDGEA